MLSKIALGLLTLSVLIPAAYAQTGDIHLYGGAVVGGEEYTKGFLGGGAIQRERLYVGVDGHGLRLNGEGEAAFQELANEIGADIKLDTYGLDISVGASVSDSNRFSVIPIGLIGYTTGEFCIETSCEDSNEVNYGGGLVAAIKGAGGRYGIHSGVRYTRNYGAAVMFGLVFTLN